MKKKKMDNKTNKKKNIKEENMHGYEDKQNGPMEDRAML